MASPLQIAESERNMTESRLDFIIHRVNQHPVNPLSLDACNDLLHHLDSLEDSLDDIHKQICYTMPDDLSTHNKAYATILEKSFAAKEKLYTIQTAISTPTATSKYQQTTILTTIPTPTITKNQSSKIQTTTPTTATNCQPSTIQTTMLIPTSTTTHQPSTIQNIIPIITSPTTTNTNQSSSIQTPIPTLTTTRCNQSITKQTTISTPTRQSTNESITNQITISTARSTSRTGTNLSRIEEEDALPNLHHPHPLGQLFGRPSNIIDSIPFSESSYTRNNKHHNQWELAVWSHSAKFQTTTPSIPLANIKQKQISADCSSFQPICVVAARPHFSRKQGSMPLLISC